MQVNNNVQSPNFGMALKIKQGGLNGKSLKDLEVLERVGELLKDTKCYHLEIDEKGSSRIVSCFANEYKGVNNISKDPYSAEHIIKFDTTWDSLRGGMRKGQSYTVHINFLNADAAEKAYTEITNASGIEREAKIVKYLDEHEVRKQAKIDEERQLKEQIERKSEELMQKYGEAVEI